VPRGVEHLIAGAGLDNPALVHDQHAIGDLLDRAKIMRDEQAGKAVAALQLRVRPGNEGSSFVFKAQMPSVFQRSTDPSVKFAAWLR